MSIRVEILSCRGCFKKNVKISICRDFVGVEILSVSRLCPVKIMSCRDFVLSRLCLSRFCQCRDIVYVEILSVSRFCLCQDFVRVQIMSCRGYVLLRLCLSRLCLSRLCPSGGHNSFFLNIEDGKFLSMCVVFYRETVLAKLYTLFLFHCKYCY